MIAVNAQILGAATVLLPTFGFIFGLLVGGRWRG